MEVKGLSIWFDWITISLPGSQSALEEPDPEELHSQSSTQNCSASFVTRACTSTPPRLFLSESARASRELLLAGYVARQE